MAGGGYASSVCVDLLNVDLLCRRQVLVNDPKVLVVLKRFQSANIQV